MRRSLMIDAAERQRVSHVVSGATAEEEPLSSVRKVEVEVRAAAGPQILSHPNSERLEGGSD